MIQDNPVRLDGAAENREGTVNEVYLLWHVHEFKDREDNEKLIDDEKFIGAYRTEEDAVAAIERLRNKPGFRHFPEGFQIVKYELNKDNWTEGFVPPVHHADGTITYEDEKYLIAMQDPHHRLQLRQ